MEGTGSSIEIRFRRLLEQDMAKLAQWWSDKEIAEATFLLADASSELPAITPEFVDETFLRLRCEFDTFAIELEDELALGDVITIAGRTTDLTQTVESLQIENKPVKSAGPGDIVGIRVGARVRPNDLVYKESEEQPAGG